MRILRHSTLPLALSTGLALALGACSNLGNAKLGGGEAQSSPSSPVSALDAEASGTFALTQTDLKAALGLEPERLKLSFIRSEKTELEMSMPYSVDAKVTKDLPAGSYKVKATYLQKEVLEAGVTRVAGEVPVAEGEADFIVVAGETASVKIELRRVQGQGQVEITIVPPTPTPSPAPTPPADADDLCGTLKTNGFICTQEYVVGGMDCYVNSSVSWRQGVPGGVAPRYERSAHGSNLCLATFALYNDLCADGHKLTREIRNAVRCVQGELSPDEALPCGPNGGVGNPRCIPLGPTPLN